MCYFHCFVFLNSFNKMETIENFFINSLTLSLQTEGHKWHVHERPPRTPGQSCSNDIGGHYNPFDVDLNSNQYSTECSPRSPLRCESGDLSGKHGKLNLGPGTASRKTYTYIDTNLNLWGDSADYSSESFTIILF